MVVVREFDQAKDCRAVEAVEESCEVGPGGKMSLLTHLLGDPLARVRHSPAFLMLVAETIGAEREIVGLIRGCIKTVTCGKNLYRSTAGQQTALPVCTKLAYILGLRVSPSHRRMGVGLNLVRKMEEWFKSMGAEYAYMATDKDNKPSVELFTGRCGYSEFRTPSILVHPVFAHPLPHRSSHVILRLPPSSAELLYRRKFSDVEFFPQDIDAVLANPNSLATFLAVPAESRFLAWENEIEAFLNTHPPTSWAALSVWNCKDVFRLEVKGAARWRRVLAAASRAVDRAAPWMRVPSVPDLFRPFGLCFLYGIGGEGEMAAELARGLCRAAHNVARTAGCEVVAAEVAAGEPVRKGIPYWNRLSLAEDLWCVKRLADGYSDVGDWTKAPPGRSIFVDPREI